MGDRSPVCRLGMYSQPLRPTQPLPSAGREMSTGQAAVTVLFGREDNRGSGVALGTCHRQIHLRARRPKEGIDGHLAYTTVKSIASCLPDSRVLLVRMITYSTVFHTRTHTRQYPFLNTLKKDRERLCSQQSGTYIDDVHLFLVVHVVDSQAALVDEEVQSGIHLHQQLLCIEHRKLEHKAGDGNSAPL